MDWGGTWLMDLSARKTHFFSFHCASKSDVIDVNMVGSILDGKSAFKILGLFLSSKMDLGFLRRFFC